MAQLTIAMKKASSDNWTIIRQPDADLDYNFETTYTSDSTRLQSGSLYAKAMFTVEQFEYKASYVSVAEMRTILDFIVKGEPFYLRYFSPTTGSWVTDRKFIVSKGNLQIGTLDARHEYYESLSFNMTSIDPIP